MTASFHKTGINADEPSNQSEIKMREQIERAAADVAGFAKASLALKDASIAVQFLAVLRDGSTLKIVDQIDIAGEM